MHSELQWLTLLFNLATQRFQTNCASCLNHHRLHFSRVFSVMSYTIQLSFYTEGGGALKFPPPFPPSPLPPKFDCLNSYNKVYNAVTKYSTILALKFVQSFYKTVVGESTRMRPFNASTYISHSQEQTLYETLLCLEPPSWCTVCPWKHIW